MTAAAPPARVYKILPRAIAEAAKASGALGRTGIDVADGYIHLSTAAQVPGTLAAHFRGARDLVLLEIDPAACFGEVRMEVSRGGEAFPHLYGAAPMEAVRAIHPLPPGEDGVPVAPDLSAPNR